MTDIKSLSFDELNSALEGYELKRFRIAQIYKWLHVFGVSSFDEMTDLPKNLRNRLSEEFCIPSCRIENKYTSALDGTVKYLFRLADGEFVESVIMKYKYGYTICISSQVGCKMGCSFCASTLAGFKRNLLPAELESQIHAAQRDLDVRISHVVLMGIGEPLDNYDNVIKFLRTLNSPDGLHLSLRDVTLSTCGIVPMIYKLAEEDMPITLTVSLHAPNDKLRSSMMPVNERWGVNEVISACKAYAKRTSRRVSFEYTLIKGVNDSEECAMQLASLLKGFISHVNLIPVNNVVERENKKPSDKAVINFQIALKKFGINATIRRTLGSDINASCGQLRRKKQETLTENGGESSENSCKNR